MPKKGKNANINPVALVLIALAGTFALAAPAAISKTLEKCAEEKYSPGDLYDLKLSSDLGFTDSDINALLEAECIAVAGPYPDNAPVISTNGISDKVSLYPNVYIHVSGSEDCKVLSDDYDDLISKAGDYIRNNIEPSLSAGREQSLNRDLRNVIKDYENNKEEAEKKTAELDDELTNLNKDYEQAKADLESEQQSIDEAKDAIFQSEKKAQSTIESGKKELAGVLDEVYSKSSVTSSDLQRAQGLSNHVSGSEKSLHEKFTNQWSAISEAESQIHEDQATLKEQKEQREQEIALEKEQLSQNAVEADARIESLNSQLGSGGARWVIEDRKALPSYAKLFEVHYDMQKLYAPAGLLIYVISAVLCFILTVGIVSRSRARIRSWQERGLEGRIISSVLIRRIALAAGIGAFIGLIIADIVAPALYMTENAGVFDISFSTLGIPWIRSFAGMAGMVIVAAIAAAFAFIPAVHPERAKTVKPVRTRLARGRKAKPSRSRPDVALPASDETAETAEYVLASDETVKTAEYVLVSDETLIPAEPVPASGETINPAELFPAGEETVESVETEFSGMEAENPDEKLKVDALQEKLVKAYL